MKKKCECGKYTKNYILHFKKKYSLCKKEEKKMKGRKVEVAKISTIIDCAVKNWGYAKSSFKGMEKKDIIGQEGVGILDFFYRQECTKTGNISMVPVFLVWNKFSNMFWKETKNNRIVKVFLLDKSSWRELNKRGYNELYNLNQDCLWDKTRYQRMKDIVWRVYKKEKRLK